MKKISLFAAFIAATAFGFTSCSDSNGGDSPSGADGEGVTAYLRVNLNPVGSAAGVASSKNFTRQTLSHVTPGTGTYQDGTEKEGGIQNARFYFFKNDGSAYYLADKGGETNATINNYLDISDWTVGNTPEDLTTIERKTSGVLVINGTTEEMPAKMVALVNLDNDAKSDLGTAALSETELLKKARTLTKYTQDGTTKENFIMSSTAYIDGAVQQSSLITSANYASTPDAAKNVNPVQLYVERLAARVDVSKGTSESWGTVSASESETLDGKAKYTLATGKTLDYVDNSGTTNVNANKNQIYVVVKGWGLADENNNAPLSKSLAATYEKLASTEDGNTNTLDAQPLSVAQYHRSFWETANSYTPIRYTFNQYAGVNTTNKTGVGYDTNNDAYNKQLGESAYTFPNTPTDPENGWSFTWNQTNRRPSANATAQAPTKVVVAAELMYLDDAGKLQAAEIGTYGGKNFLGEDGVKKAIAADVLASFNNKVCLREGSEGAYTYTPITTADINFIVSGEPGGLKSYKLTPVIATDESGALTKAYYTYNPTSREYEEISSAADVNAKLLAVAGSDITIYKGGNTYYYTTLQHLWFPSNFTTADAATKPTNAGAWGVVRNHLYKVTLNTIAGWGTPVYNPEEIIIPVTPSDNESYLGAQINVLMWRVVNQDADLNGTPVNN